jgi:hypothetical protein
MEVYMSLTNVKSKWIDGDLYFYDKASNEILHFDGVNRELVIPTGSALIVGGVSVDSSSLAVTGLTATAAELNALHDMPASVSMTTTPASGSCAVQLTFKNAAGVALSHAISGFGYSSTVDGLAIAAVTSLATLVNGIEDVITTTKDFHFITSAVGLFGITLTAPAGTYYLTFILPNGKMITTGAIVVNS